MWGLGSPLHGRGRAHHHPVPGRSPHVAGAMIMPHQETNNWTSHRGFYLSSAFAAPSNQGMGRVLPLAWLLALCLGAAGATLSEEALHDQLSKTTCSPHSDDALHLPAWSRFASSTPCAPLPPSAGCMAYGASASGARNFGCLLRVTVPTPVRVTACDHRATACHGVPQAITYSRRCPPRWTRCSHARAVT